MIVCISQLSLSLQLFDLLLKIALQESEIKDEFEIVSSSDLVFDYSSSINSRFHLQNLLKYAISQISSLLIRLPTLRQCLPSRVNISMFSSYLFYGVAPKTRLEILICKRSLCYSLKLNRKPSKMCRFLGEEEFWSNFALFFPLFRTLVLYILIKKT